MLRQTFYALVCLALSFPLNTAYAQNAANSSSVSNSGAAAGARNNNSFYSEALRQAPSLGVPGLAASVQTCLGSRSFGVTGPGFGVGFGTTYRAKHCETIANAQILRILGKRKAAVQALCFRKELAGALQSTGTECKVGRHINRPATLPTRVRSGRNSPGKTVTAKASSNVPFPHLCTGGKRFVEVRNRIYPCQ